MTASINNYTVGKGIVEPSIIDHRVVFGALCGAIVWNVITWYYGIPSSSSHALIGGIVGAVIAKAGAAALVAASVLKTVIFIFVSPMLGFLLGSASGVGLVPEQAWENPDLPPSPFGTAPECASIGFQNGKAVGSASPLTWSAAQFVRDHRRATLFDLQGTHRVPTNPAGDRLLRNGRRRHAVGRPQVLQLLRGLADAVLLGHVARRGRRGRAGAGSRPWPARRWQDSRPSCRIRPARPTDAPTPATVARSAMVVPNRTVAPSRTAVLRLKVAPRLAERRAPRFRLRASRLTAAM